MTATEARRTLDATDAAIVRNVADPFAGRIEPILIRGKVCEAERIYTSGRGDYIAYRYRGGTYRVDTLRALNPNGAP